MKIQFILLISIFLGISTITGQKSEFRIQAGANVTFMPDFNNVVAILNDGIAVSGVISVANSISPIIICETSSRTEPGMGFEASLDFEYSLRKGWKLFNSVGFDLMRYDYDTYISAEGTPNLWLSEYTEEYGNTSFYYINLKPINVSKDFFENRLTLMAGATLNINVYSKYSNVLVIYSEEAVAEGKVDGIERLYFDTSRAANGILVGIHGKAECRIISSLSGFISYEYFFNSVYHKETYSDEVIRNARPSQLNLGLSYSFWHSGK
jgi:hypothetical protein